VTLVQTGASASNVDSVTFKVKYQGCADIGVCYPPQTRTLTVALPVAEGASAAAKRGSASALAPKGASVLGAGDALPEAQAFKAEAIANTASEILVRLTPAKGYYLYRDKTSFRIARGEGVVAGAPRCPPASRTTTSTSATCRCGSTTRESPCRCSARSPPRRRSRWKRSSRAASPTACAIRR
jgi:thiol:disulfide interchange protein DsbD